MRITHHTIKIEQQSRIFQNYQNLKRVQSQLSSGKKYSQSRENPVATIQSIYDKSKLRLLSQYQKNTDYAKSQIDLTFGYLGQMIESVNQIKELTIQGINGSYTKEDRQNIAVSLEEILRGMISISNSSYGNSYLLGGSRTQEKPFYFTEKQVENLSTDKLIQKVTYQGDHQVKSTYISDQHYISVSVNGSEALFTDGQYIKSYKNIDSYITQKEQTVSINGKKINIEKDLNLDSILSSLNEQLGGVEFSKEENLDGTFHIVVKSLSTYNIKLLDLSNSTLFQDLGFIKTAKGEWNEENIMVESDNLFNRIVQLRDDFLNNRVKEVSVKHLASVERGINSLINTQANISGQQEIIELNQEYIAYQQEKFQEQLNQIQSVDIAEASINYNEISRMHNINLMVASKLLQPTLMDYI